MNDEYDFDSENLTEEEANRMLYALARLIQEDEETACFVNVKREAQVAAAYMILEYVLQDSEVTVSYELHEFFNSMGGVSIVGREISITNTECFLAAVELADDMEVYPRTDGKVKMDFGFHGLTRKEVSYSVQKQVFARLFRRCCE